MAFLDSILALPHAYLWLPGVIFAVVVGGAYWLVRPTTQITPETKADKVEQPAAVEKAGEKAGDQRNALRRQGNPVEVHIAALDAKDDPVIGSVLDRSLGGIRLIMYTEVDVGAIFAIRPVICQEIVPWVEVEVRSCRISSEMPGRFEVGCQYVKSPPYSIQMLFG